MIFYLEIKYFIQGKIMEQDTGKRKTNTWIWIIAILAAIVIIVFILMVGNTQDGEREIPDVSKRIEMTNNFTG